MVSELKWVAGDVGQFRMNERLQGKDMEIAQNNDCCWRFSTRMAFRHGLFGRETTDVGLDAARGEKTHWS